MGLRYFLAAAAFLTICLASFSPVIPVHAASSNVVITSDADFLTCGCVSGGSGTSANPYLISGLTILQPRGYCHEADADRWSCSEGKGRQRDLIRNP